MALACFSKRGKPFRERFRERWEQFKERFNAVLCPFDSPFPWLQPAFAGAPSSFVADGFGAPDKPSVCRFDTGPLPDKNSPSTKVINWESVRVLYPGEITPEIRKSPKPYIAVEQAQKEVSRLLSERCASHQYIVYEACKLSDNPKVDRYTLHLMLGALGEDYVFLPGEKLDDMIKTGLPVYADHIQKNKVLVPADEMFMPGGQEIPGFFEGLFRVTARILRKLFKKDPAKDQLNRPYMAHFYNPAQKDTPGLILLDGEIKFQSALERIKTYWKTAAVLYKSGDEPRAFYALGHLLHLVGDLHVPAHVHNDPHGPTFILGKLDSLEQWCIRCDYPDIKRPVGKPNIRIWDSGPIAPLKPMEDWNESNIDEKIAEYINALVFDTQQFRSVDRKGTRDDQKRKGRLSDQECYEQCSHLIPKAIQRSAQLIDTFMQIYDKKQTGA